MKKIFGPSLSLCLFILGSNNKFPFSSLQKNSPKADRKGGRGEGGQVAALIVTLWERRRHKTVSFLGKVLISLPKWQI